MARWNREQGCRPALDEAPTFTPSEEEFKNPLLFFSTIRPIAERYGICRIVPPASWKPILPLRDKLKYKQCQFPTKVQQIHKLQNRGPSHKDYSQRKLKRRRLSRMSTLLAHQVKVNDDDAEFGFDSGPEFTMEKFQKHANDFKCQHFGIQKSESILDSTIISKTKPKWTPSVENIEGEYWHIIENSTEQIEVFYGSDLDTSTFGSRFPVVKLDEGSDPYLTSGWNLMNIGRLPGSMLSFEEDNISGVVVPWLYLGMCFSSFCWHVEDHYFYSLNYMHLGAPKVWYGVPSSAAQKFEQAMKKQLPHLFEEQPDLLHKLVTQLSPTRLKSEGVPVYRCVQNARDFILAFPQAYHAGFNSGFNVAESVNVAPVEWLPSGQKAVDDYKILHRKTTISTDKLLIGASRDTVKKLWKLSLEQKNQSSNHGFCGFSREQELLTNALKVRVDEERFKESIVNKFSHKVRISNSYREDKERECFLCYRDLYLSAVTCGCSPGSFACLDHSDKLCSCPLSRMTFIYRYDLDELHTLIKTLEGDQSSFTMWATKDFGVSLPSHTNLLDSQQKKKNNSSINKRTSLLTGSQMPFTNTSTAEQNIISKSSLSQIEKTEIRNESEITLINNDENEYTENNKKKERKGVFYYENSFCTYVTNGSKKDVCAKENLGKKLCDENMSMADLQIASLSNGTCRMNTMDIMVPSLFEKDSNGGTTSSNEINKQAEMYGSGSLEKGRSLELNRSNNLGSQVKNDVVNTHPFKGSIYDVELLNLGSLSSCNYWHDDSAIYPKGFKSCVNFYSFFSPIHRCRYISEIIDVGMDHPLFKVTMEDYPNETFLHTSIQKCWDLVQEKLENELKKQKNHGRIDIFYSHALESIDGLRMFGLLSEEIVQKVESLDLEHKCVKYWTVKSGKKQERGSNESRISEYGKTDSCLVGSAVSSPEQKLDQPQNNKEPESSSRHKMHEESKAKNTVSADVFSALDDLFRKGNPQELWTFHKVLTSDYWGPYWKAAYDALAEHLNKL